MGKKRETLYAVIIDGLRKQLNDDELRLYIAGQIENVTDSRIVKATILGFSDPSVQEPALIEKLAALAARYRVRQFGDAALVVSDTLVTPDTVNDEPEAAPVMSDMAVPVRARKAATSAGNRRARSSRNGIAS